MYKALRTKLKNLFQHKLLISQTKAYKKLTNYFFNKASSFFKFYRKKTNKKKIAELYELGKEDAHNKMHDLLKFLEG